MIAYLLGGRAAEKIIFNQFTTGAGNDIERATNLAHKMVCEWGMSERLGPLTYGTKEEEIFLGREITRSKNYSETTSITIDEEVKNIVMTGMIRAEKILRENLEALNNLATALLEREILDGDEIEKAIRGEPLPPLASGRNGQQPAASPEPQAQSPAPGAAQA
jgi:cell division protease FtsH